MPDIPVTVDPQTTSTETTTTPPNTPPVIESPKPPENQDLIRIYDQVLAERERDNRQLQERIQKLEAEKSAPPADPTADRNAIFERPREIIRDEVNKAIAPLIDAVSVFRNDSLADQYLRKYANDPRFRDVWPIIEPHIRNAMGNIRGEINDQAVMTLVLGAIGAYHAGFITDSRPKPPASPTPTPPNNSTTRLDMNTPPHLRPSAPPVADPTPAKPKRRELTENEKRLARMKGMSDDKYLDYLEMPSNRVVGPNKAEVSQ